MQSASSDECARVVVVTGASSGIGLATALAAARHGDHVVLFARGLAALQVAATACEGAGAASSRLLCVDVRDAAAVQDAVRTVLQWHGHIDAVVHSAGVVAYGRFEDVPPEVFDRVITTNVLGPANVVRAVLPGMRQRGTGAIVVLGSLLGRIAAPHMSAYAVSKWAVRSLVRHLQVENRDLPGVTISCLSPGGVDTPIYLQAANYLGHVGRPPPPVLSPEKVAAAALRLIDHPRRNVEVGATNRLVTLGFAVLPRLYDAIVTPLFDVAATDRRHPTPAGPGNVLQPTPEAYRLHGDQGSAVHSILAGVRSRLLGPPDS
ncbi:MAG: SDR family NAD(P)-dependent oxidoreductase [Nocardioidaceae bacterium]|nr:SDR family NAD(P)-dependent oxidoreductase [Nocardioidaceae bacterium]